MTFAPIPRYYNPSLSVSLLGQTVLFRDGLGLDVKFRIQRTTQAVPDTCAVEIEGIALERRLAMGALFSTVGSTEAIVLGGYDGVQAGMFRGTLREFRSTVRSGAATKTTFRADDGGDAIADANLPSKVKSTIGLTPQNAIDLAVAALSAYETLAGRAPIVAHPSVAAIVAASDPSRTTPYTAVHVGSAKDLLDKTCRRIRARWWIRDGQLFLGRRGFVDASRPAVLVTPQTLIAEPAIEGSGLQTLQVFFDPNIVPGSQVVYLGSHLRVEAVVHQGRTRGEVWSSTITGRSL